MVIKKIGGPAIFLNGIALSARALKLNAVNTMPAPNYSTPN